MRAGLVIVTCSLAHVVLLSLAAPLPNYPSTYHPAELDARLNSHWNPALMSENSDPSPIIRRVKRLAPTQGYILYDSDGANHVYRTRSLVNNASPVHSIRKRQLGWLKGMIGHEAGDSKMTVFKKILGSMVGVTTKDTWRSALENSLVQGVAAGLAATGIDLAFQKGKKQQVVYVPTPIPDPPGTTPSGPQPLPGMPTQGGSPTQPGQPPRRPPGQPSGPQGGRVLPGMPPSGAPIPGGPPTRAGPPIQSSQPPQWLPSQPSAPQGEKVPPGMPPSGPQTRGGPPRQSSQPPQLVSAGSPAQFAPIGVPPNVVATQQGVYPRPPQAARKRDLSRREDGDLSLLPKVLLAIATTLIATEAVIYTLHTTQNKALTAQYEHAEQHQQHRRALPEDVQPTLDSTAPWSNLD